jgi:hypothetical protein
MSPLVTALSPPVNNPAEYSTPVEPALVELFAINAPFTVPLTLIENITAFEVAFEPEEAEANVN